MRTGSFSSEQQRDFLRRFRLQLFAFGSQFDDLPRLLGELNPNRTKAREWRTQIARALLADGTAGKSSDFANVIEGVRSNVGDLRGAAKELLQKRQLTSTSLRSQLEALQQVISAVVDGDRIKRQIDRWSHGDVTAYEGDFREAVREANRSAERRGGEEGRS